jgi:hypothetical protein
MLRTAAATVDGKDILASGLQISTDTNLNIVLAAPGAIVDGVVKDESGKTISDDTVVLVPDAPFRDAGPLYRSVTSDVRGRFELRGIAPGAYHLFAFSNMDGAAYRNADFMKEFEDKGMAIHIGKSEHFSEDLTGL